MKIKLLLLFIMAFGSKESEIVGENGTARGEFERINAEKPIIVKIEEDEYVKIKKRHSSEYIGVSYHKCDSKWQPHRRSKFEHKLVYNGYYDSEEVAAHASDTLARKLMKNGEKGHKLNFPDDGTEFWYKGEDSSKFIGLSYHKRRSKWQAHRRSKFENKMVYNGYYDNEEEAAHASDTVARKLTQNGEQGHKLNFPDDDTEVHKRIATSKYFGVSYHKHFSKWQVQRHSKNENKKNFYNGYHDNEEVAAHMSDTLARELMKNGEQGHKLNFPDDETDVAANKKKRKRLENLKNLQDN